MSRKRQALAGATAVATGPSGLRRLLAGCLMVILLGGLALGALFGFAAWTAKHSGNEASAPLPCPPSSVAVAWSTKDAPSAAREAVAEAIRGSGRKPVSAGWETSEERDLVIVWSPGTGTAVSTTSSPVKLTLGAVPTAADVREALGARLAPCGATATPSATAAPQEPQQPAQGTGEGRVWPWERGLGTTGALGLTLAVWWLAGPNLARGAWRAVWPVRLGRRRWQRWGYRRARRRGVVPAEWPLRVSPGQRWDESREAMGDKRTYRAQIADGEPERRAALREAIREERLAGVGIGPASLWRFIYRAPNGGAPEMEEVSSCR